MSVSSRHAYFRTVPGMGSVAVDDLAEVLAGGPTPFSVTVIGVAETVARRVGSVSDIGLAETASPPPAVPELTVYLSVLPAGAGTATGELTGWTGAAAAGGGRALVIVAVDAAVDDNRPAIASRLADAAAQDLPEASVIVACGAPRAFLDFVVQTMTGGPESNREVRLGAVREALLARSASTDAGFAIEVRGAADDALLLRRAAAPPAMLANPNALVGTRLMGRYEIVDKLGAGGMGVVYRARQIGMDRDVAVKVLSATLAADELALARFRREARLLSRLRHPNLVTVHDFGVTDDGLAFIAMEMLQGHALSDLMSGDTPLSIDRCLALFDQTCAAVEAAHQQGIIHRDLKPENLFVERLPNGAEHLRVLDFGLARARETESVATAQGVVMGTPAYMAPEQVRGGETDERTDLYQLGAVLYHMLTGRRPFVGLTPMSVMMQHLSAEPPPLQSLRPETPPRLAALVEALLHKAPAERPTTIGEVRARLAALGSLAAAPPRAPEPPLEVRPLPSDGAANASLKWAAGAAAALALAVAGYGLTREASRPIQAVVEPTLATPPVSAATAASTAPVAALPAIGSLTPASAVVLTPVSAPPSRAPQRPVGARPSADPGKAPSVDDAIESELSGMTR